MATWFMGSINGKPIDFHALATLLSGRYLSLIWLTAPGVFYSTYPTSYLLAGSFTGYLIRRFGWERYAEFFRRSKTKGFESTFDQVYGLSLLAAEQQWRNDLLGRRHSFEPELTRFMGEQSVEAAYEAGQVYRCLQEVETLSRSGQISGKVLWYAACAHLCFGHYNEAASALEQAMHSEDVWVRAVRGPAWLQLGNLYDLLGQRDKAVPAYWCAMAEPDHCDSPPSSTHALANRYLREPFTEKDLQRSLRRMVSPAHGQRQWRRR